MPLVKDSRVQPDPWQHLDEDTPLPASDAPAHPAITLSLARWERDAASLRDWSGRLGLRLGAGETADRIGAQAHRFDLICIAFPAFTDGRGYSTARLLRSRHGFRGELRATGQILRDQFFFLHRVGFDAVEARDAGQAAQWGEALAEISVVYQSAQDARPSIPRSRWQPRAAAE